MNETKRRDAAHRLWESVGRTPEERLVTPPRIGETMPDATLELRADSGHLPWLDAPESVADATNAFLRGAA